MIGNELKVLEKTSLLYVNDSENSSSFLIEKLVHIFKTVHVVTNEFDAQKIYLEKKPTFIIADMSNKRINALKFIRNIRKVDSKINIALTYENDDLNEVLKMVEFNLTKMLLKPIVDAELKQLLKIFSSSCTQNPIHQIAPYWIFESNNYVIKGPFEDFVLTKKEWSFMKMIFNEDKIITYHEMKLRIWDDSGINDNVIHSFIKNMRKKLPEKSLMNVSGIGYRIAT